MIEIVCLIQVFNIPITYSQYKLLSFLGTFSVINFLIGIIPL